MEVSIDLTDNILFGTFICILIPNKVQK